MKYHWPVKLIAILLATLLLAASIASGLSILCLGVTGLYSQTVKEVYSEQVEDECHSFAVNLAHRYASLELGEIPEPYLDQYYGTSWMYNSFQPGTYFYTISDAEGKILESTLTTDMGTVSKFEIELTDINYRLVVPEGTKGNSVFIDSYWDYEKEEMVEITYRIDKLDLCTVAIYLQEGALQEEPYWEILRGLYEIRMELIWSLTLCLVGFGAVLIYLCCSAGRKSREDEVRPEGLNRMPLDLYLVLGIIAESLLIICGMEGFEYLIYEASSISLYFAVALILLGSLIIVGFLFAFAAQVKTKGGYWWRHSICGWCLGLVFRFLRWIGRGMKWLRNGIRGVFNLLPVIWQWLLTAFGLVAAIGLSAFLSMASYGFGEVFWGFVCAVCVLGSIVLVLYGGYCFGTLLKSAKYMAQGHLEHKIDTKYLYGAFRDFGNQLNNLAEGAKIAAERQMKSERMKTELITNVSHDIKTPLTSIINYVDLMKKPHSESDGALYLEVLDRQSQRLKKLIDDLMEMSKASTGNLTVELTQVDAVEAINQALGEFSDKLSSVNLTPVFRHPDYPVYMNADGRLLWRVLSNLLSNAYKYAMPDTRLYVDLMVLQGNAVIAVKNISREQLNVNADELMERFVRGDASRNTEGSGLGLNIAKSLVELQQGQMHLMVDGDLFKVTLIFPLA